MFSKRHKSKTSTETTARLPAPIVSAFETLEDRQCMSATTGTEVLVATPQEPQTAALDVGQVVTRARDMIFRTISGVLEKMQEQSMNTIRQIRT